MRATIAPHIWLDDRGVSWVDDTNTKVREIVLDVLAYGWSPQEIHLNHPHLSLAQIHAALTYYYDHKADLDREIAESETRIAELRKQAGQSLVKKKLEGSRSREPCIVHGCPCSICSEFRIDCPGN